jgi:hypothetical protein
MESGGAPGFLPRPDGGALGHGSGLARALEESRYGRVAILANVLGLVAEPAGARSSEPAVPRALRQVFDAAFYMGMKRLFAGDRARAREHLIQCIETG